MDTWTEESGALTKTFTFADFQAALQFVNKVGAIAESMQHHPDICIKNYKTVTITTTTHDAGNTVTQKDRALAEKIESIS